MAAEKNKIEVVLALLDKATAPIAAINKRIASIQEPVRRLNNKLVLLGKEGGLGRLTDAAGGVRKAFGGVTDEVSNLFGIATKAAAGVGVIGGALFGLVKMTANTGDAFDELSTKAGVSASFFQKSAYAASFASVSQEALAASMSKMNANIVGAVSGSKEMQLWFKRAGISTQDLRKMKPEQVFSRVIDQVNKLPKDSAKAGALMRAIFGKSGGDLLPMVESFKELTAEAERLGLVLSDADVKAGAEFNDTFDKMMKVMKGVGMLIGSLLMPHFKEAIELITTWTLANRELIKTKVAEWIARLRENWPEIKQAALDAFAAIKQIIGFIAGAIEFVGGFGNALKIVALVMAGPLLLSIAMLAKAFVALGLAIMTTPFGWIAAAIVAAVGLIAGAAYLIYKNWGPIKEFFASLWAGVVETISAAIDLLKFMFLNFSPLGLIVNNWSSIEEWFSGMWDRITAKFSAGVAWIKDILSKLNPFSSSGNATFGAPSQPMTMGAPAGVAPVAAGALGSGFSSMTNNAKVEVDFKNVPRGVEVTPGANNKAPLDLSMGYSMATF